MSVYGVDGRINGLYTSSLCISSAVRGLGSTDVVPTLSICVLDCILATVVEWKNVLAAPIVVQMEHRIASWSRRLVGSRGKKPVIGQCCVAGAMGYVSRIGLLPAVDQVPWRVSTGWGRRQDRGRV